MAQTGTPRGFDMARHGLSIHISVGEPLRVALAYTQLTRVIIWKVPGSHPGMLFLLRVEATPRQGKPVVSSTPCASQMQIVCFPFSLIYPVAGCTSSGSIVGFHKAAITDSSQDGSAARGSVPLPLPRPLPDPLWRGCGTARACRRPPPALERYAATRREAGCATAGRARLGARCLR